MSSERTLFAPPPYVAADPVAIVRRYPFANFITSDFAGMRATAIPLFFEFDDDTTTMIGHLARRNSQAVAFHSGQSALAIFSGPHTYISASWYRERPGVPTWNYVTAHVRGTIEPIDDDSMQRAILRRAANQMERNSDAPWTMESVSSERIDSLVPMIRSFRMKVDRIEGVTKLSQTQPPGDRVRVIDQLRSRSEEGDHEVVRWMVELGLDK